MDPLYLKPFMKLMELFTVLTITTTTTKAQGLVFKNASLQQGTAGIPGAVYCFLQVTAGIDTLVSITGRSSNKCAWCTLTWTIPAGVRPFNHRLLTGIIPRLSA
jgi:hypothetical protein